jgi:hypothetical protein
MMEKVETVQDQTNQLDLLINVMQSEILHRFFGAKIQFLKNAKRVLCLSNNR